MKSIKKIAAVILRGGLLLVVRKRGSDLFISPGGKPEANETPIETLTRELNEEVGMSIQRHAHFGNYSGEAALESGTCIDVESYFIESSSIAIPSHEIEEVAWIDAGYKSQGICLASILEKHILPRLCQEGLMRRVRPIDRSAKVAVVCDLDGTLAMNGVVGEAVRKALRQISDRNVRLIFATSRAFRGAEDLLGDCCSKVELICCNGAAVRDLNSSIRKTAIHSDTVSLIVDFLQNSSAEFWVEYGDKFVCSNASTAPWMNYPDRINLTSGTRVDCNGVVKICVIGAVKWPAFLTDAIRQTARLVPHNDHTLDIVSIGVSKAASVFHLLGNSKHTVIGFGNDLNDQELIAHADRSVVVGEGLPGVEYAHHVRRILASDAEVAKALLEEIDFVMDIDRC